MINRRSSSLRLRSRSTLRADSGPLSPDRPFSPSQTRPPGFPFVGDYANAHILLWVLAPTPTHDAREGKADR